MPDRPDLSAVPGLARRDLVAEVAAESREVTESPESRDSLNVTALRDVLESVRSVTDTERATYHLSADGRELVEWLRRYLPGDLDVPTRSEAVGAAIRIAAKVVARVTGEDLPG